MNRLKLMSLWLALGSLIPLAQAQDAIIINGQEVKVGPGQEVIVKDGKVTVTTKEAAAVVAGTAKAEAGAAGGGTITVQGEALASEETSWLGVITSPVSPVLQSQLGLEEGTGLVVDFIAKDAPAQDLLKLHDIICKFDGQKVGESNQLRELVLSKKPGTEVSLLVRRAGKDQTIKVKLALRPADEPMTSGLVQINPLPPSLAGKVPLRLQGLAGRPSASGKTLRSFSANSCIVENDGHYVYTLRIDGAANQAVFSVNSQDGKIEFDGPVNTDAEKAKVPAPFQEKLGKLLDSRKNLQVMVQEFGEMQPLPAPGIPVEHLRLIEEQRKEMERVKQQMELQRQELQKIQEEMLKKAAPAGK